jgi:hypothetical protein
VTPSLLLYYTIKISLKIRLTNIKLLNIKSSQHKTKNNYIIGIFIVILSLKRPSSPGFEIRVVLLLD